ncbi:hypothetical protein FS749_006656 [Ceratobasidium sp. UAMH 11750]|nr:hypothetical protein FS749_006656 [Ceratobasidium sp. UAMH 11750]
MSEKRYIVVFKDDAPQSEIDKAIAEVEAAGGNVTQRYDGTVLNGFAAAIPDSHFQSLQAASLTSGSKIDYIEPDGVVTTQ